MRRHMPAANICSLLLALLTASLSAQENNPGSVLAVLDFTNSSLVDHAAYDPFRVGIAGLLITDLARNPDLVVVERERLRQVLDELELSASGQVDAGTAARVGKVLGAHHMIVGVYVIDPRGNLRIDARAVNVETSQVEHVETVEGEADDLLEAVSLLGARLSAGLDLPTARREIGLGRLPTPPQVRSG